jgi:hypothetical protein
MEVCSLIIALVAVIVGPIISWKIAKRQISASTVTTSRQQWINTLRDAISDFSAKASMIYCLAKNQYADEQSIPRIEGMLQLNYKIELLINPNEEDHAILAQLVTDIASSLMLAKVKKAEIDTDLDKKQAEIVSLSQKIFKREWERVKKGEK